MIHGDLFAGIGGFSLGLEQAGFVCEYQCEIDKHARLVLSEHWPETWRDSDIHDVDGSDLRGLELICGGDPCQRNSTASGPWKSKAPALGGEFVRIVGEAEPVWIIRENPTRIRRDAPWPPERFAACLEALGYECVIVDVQCAAFTGVSRYRTFVVGSDPARASRFGDLLSDSLCAVGRDPQVDGPRPIFAALTCHPFRYSEGDGFIVERDGNVRVLDRCERLRAQGFPDTWLPEQVSFYRAARLCGNAMPVPVARWLGELVMKAEQGQG